MQWTAPEILNGQGTYSKETDVFSFAMVAIEVRYRWSARLVPLLTGPQKGIHGLNPVR